MGISLKQLFPQFNPESEQISEADFRNQSKINSLFQLLLEESAVLKINLQGSKTSFSSCITAVDIKNSLFTLDELHPTNGNKLLLSTGHFIAHAIIKGVNVSFHTSLIKLDKDKQFNKYNCDIPNSISYIQRRREYRVRISEPLSIQVTAQHENSSQLLQGRIHDISMQGMGIDFSTTQAIKPGDYLTNCKLGLPKGESIGFTLEARHIQSTKQGTLRIGGKFKELNTRSEEIICRFVREMERASIKK
jgi:c-di-GMP-binding flagellar brake protein YcgR